MASNFAETLLAEIQQAEDQLFQLFEQQQHLEARVEGLKQALDLWRKSDAAAAPTERTAKVVPVTKAKRRYRKRPGKFEKVMGFIRDQGEKGATIEEMFRFATAQGLKLKRPSIRSHIFNRKSELVKMGEGRYRVAMPKDKASESAEGPTGGNPVEPSLKLVGAA